MKIEQNVLENQYKGCGKAWAAVKDGVVVGIIYMSSHGIAEIGEVVSGMRSCGEFFQNA